VLHEAGVLVHLYEPTDSIKPCFGHLALLYGKPRSASVIARSSGVLWALDRPVFRRIIVKKNRREVS
jgi:Cyclic nucleotide-binding domain